MTRIEQLALKAEQLSDDQLDGLIAFAAYLRSEPLIGSAPPDVLEAMERGIADADAGRVTTGEQVMERLRSKIAAATP